VVSEFKELIEPALQIALVWELRIVHSPRREARIEPRAFTTKGTKVHEGEP
jgi:hypothetical protein